MTAYRSCSLARRLERHSRCPKMAWLLPGGMERCARGAERRHPRPPRTVRSMVGRSARSRRICGSPPAWARPTGRLCASAQSASPRWPGSRRDSSGRCVRARVTRATLRCANLCGRADGAWRLQVVLTALRAVFVNQFLFNILPKTEALKKKVRSAKGRGKLLEVRCVHGRSRLRMRTAANVPRPRHRACGGVCTLAA